MRLRILHVIDALGRGGAERLLVELANESTRRGHDVHCCVTRSQTTLAGDLLPEVRLHVLGRTRRFDIAAMRRFHRLSQGVSAEVLHAHSRSTVAFLCAVRVIAGPLPPVVFQDHFGGEGKLPRWFSIVGRFIVQQYVAVAPRLAGWARRSGFPAGRLRVIGNRLSLRRLDATAPSPLRELVGVADSTRLGICVCGIREDKGVDILVEAIAALTARSVDVHVAVVGRDADRAYAAETRKLARERGVGDRVHFIGERADALGLMRRADFGVMPSRSESGPLVLIEYLAAALPVVTTRTGEVADRLAELGLEGVVPPGDYLALADAIEHLVRAPGAELARRGAHGRALAEQHFDLSAVLPQWEQVYADAVYGHRSSR